jgi:DNA-directed RNA polymerase subunit M/transcription elongation factor TFIIS
MLIPAARGVMTVDILREAVHYCQCGGWLTVQEIDTSYYVAACNCCGEEIDSRNPDFWDRLKSNNIEYRDRLKLKLDSAEYPRVKKLYQRRIDSINSTLKLFDAMRN